MTPLRRAVALAVLGLALLPGAALGGIYARVRDVYDARGSIPPCQFTARQLATALRGVDVYGQQYFGDFTQAIQTALDERASGACLPAPSSGAAAAGGGAGARLRLPPVTAATRAGAPLPLLVLAGLSALALLLATATAGRRWLGFDQAPGAWRQLWAEMGWRIGGLRAELSARRARRPPG